MLENSLFTSLFPRTAKRQSRPADMFARTESPITDMPYVAEDVSVAAPDERVNVEQIDTPVDDRVSINEGGATTQPFVPTQQELTGTSDIASLSKMPFIDPDRPEFELPYPEPKSMYEQTQNALAKGQYDVQNPRNRDKGFKGALKEALQNFAFGLSHAQPGMGFWESMALGGTGLGAGLVDRSANEKREAMRNLPMLQQNAKIASDEQMRQKQIENIDADNETNRLRIAEAAKAKIAAQQGQDRRKLAGMLTFDPSNPAHKLQAKAAGLSDEEIAAMQGWDFKNPVSHLINGERFKLNRATGAYEPAEGLPVDKQKELVAFDAVDENGRVTATYMVLPEKAAALAQQFRLKNLELKARKELQDDRQTFQAGQTQAKQNYQTSVRAAKNDDEAKETLIAIEANKDWTPAQKEAVRAKLYELHPNLKP